MSLARELEEQRRAQYEYNHQLIELFVRFEREERAQLARNEPSRFIMPKKFKNLHEYKRRQPSSFSPAPHQGNQ